MKRQSRKQWFSISEAAKLLKVSRQAVFEALGRGELRGKKGKIVQVKTTRGWRISVKSLRDYEVSLRHQEAGKKIPDA